MANLGQMLRQLRKERGRAENQLERLDEAIGVFQKLVGKDSRGAVPRKNSRGPRKLSAAARRRISKAQKARWAKLRQQQRAAKS
jgi:hypothetical protein